MSPVGNGEVELLSQLLLAAYVTPSIDNCTGIRSSA